MNFYVWVNLWYSYWETIKLFYDTNINNSNEENEVNENQNETQKEHYVSVNFNKNMTIEMQKLKDDFSIESGDSGRKLKSGDISKNTANFENENFGTEVDLNSNLQKKSLYEIIFKMKHNTNLNELIDKINNGQKNKLNKKKLKITLNSKELDKFEEKKKMDYVSLTILYSLMDKD